MKMQNFPPKLVEILRFSHQNWWRFHVSPTKTSGNHTSLPPKLVESGFEDCQKPHENQRPAFCQKIIKVQALFLEHLFV